MNLQKAGFDGPNKKQPVNKNPTTETTTSNPLSDAQVDKFQQSIAAAADAYKNRNTNQPPAPANKPVGQPNAMPKVRQKVQSTSREEDDFGKFITHLSSGKHNKAEELINQMAAQQGLGEYQDKLQEAWNKKDFEELKRLSREHKAKFFPDQKKEQLRPDQPVVSRAYHVKGDRLVSQVNPSKLVEDRANEITDVAQPEVAQAPEEKKAPNFPDINSMKEEDQPAPPPPPPAPKQVVVPPNADDAIKTYGKSMKKLLAANGFDPEKTRAYLNRAQKNGYSGKTHMSFKIPPADVTEYLIEQAMKL